MSVNKLKAIDYPLAAVFDANDQKSFRMLVLWLEETIIQTYETDERNELQNIDSPTWDTAFKNYCRSCSSPIKSTQSVDQLEWLLGLAVRKAYNAQRNEFDSKTKEWLEVSSDASIVVTENTIDNFEASSPEFKEGIESIADVLNISKHPDHAVTLEAIHKFVTTRLNPDAIKNPSTVIPKGEAFPLEKVKGHAINSKDPAILKAVKILRLAQLHRLRDLQTCINECIVDMQQVTSNPKTDTTLGKVGY